MNVNNLVLKRFEQKLLLLCLPILVCMLFVPITLKAQTEIEYDGWIYIQESEGVKFYYAKGVCEEQPVLFLKMINGNTTQITGSWNLAIEADERNLVFSDIIMPINAGGEAFGSCSSLDPRLLIPADLSALHINKIIITASIEKE